MRFLIIGGSAAGFAAAKAIRNLDADSPVTVLSTDTRLYSRVKLHQIVSGGKKPDAIGFLPQGFLEEYHIDWRGGTEVTGIFTTEKCVSLRDGQSLPYDKLLIATGADAVIPPIPHFREAPNVYGLRTLSDALRLYEAGTAGKKCVVIGSGLVGLDAAMALSHRNVSVTLVEMADRLSPLQLDSTAAAPYQQRFEDKGCKFHFSVKAQDSQVTQDGNISGVCLDNGVVLPCDFVVAAAGVRSSVAFLEGSPIQCNRGVKVDAFLRTSAPDVFCAGDAAGVAGSWSAASAQGDVAGKNMCGLSVPYEPAVSKNALSYFGLTTVSIGGPLPNDGQVYTEQSDNSYLRVVLKDNVPVHAILQGDISKAPYWQKQIQSATPV